MATLYIVFAIDAEGPLTEKRKHTFKRLEEYFGVKIKTSLINLLKLQKGKFRLSPKSSKYKNNIKEILKPHYLNTYQNWKDLNKRNKHIFSNKFREKFKDDKNQSIIFDWYCLDHVNYKTNPRFRDLGHHKIFNRYEKLIKNHSYQDQLQWHFHPIPFNLKANFSGNNITYKSTHIEILCRKIIDKNWFPSSFRPTASVRSDLNFFLEQWIPFELGNMNVDNQRTNKRNSYRINSIYGLHNDSRGSPTDWSIYNPSYLDSRKPGSLKRSIARCLKIYGYNLSIDENEIRKAFTRAKSKNTLLSLTLHDFRDIESEIQYFYFLLNKVRKEFPKQKFIWSNSVNAFRNCLGLKKITLKLDIKLNSNLLIIKSNSKIFGFQPFLAMKTKNNRYLHDNLIPDENNIWRYSFDTGTIEQKNLVNIGIAANNLTGSTVVYVANLLEKKIKWNKTTYN